MASDVTSSGPVRTILIASVLALFLIGATAAVFMSKGGKRILAERAVGLEILSKSRAVYVALKEHADTHTGLMPKEIETLVEKKLLDPINLVPPEGMEGTLFELSNPGGNLHLDGGSTPVARSLPFVVDGQTRRVVVRGAGFCNAVPDSETEQDTTWQPPTAPATTPETPAPEQPDPTPEQTDPAPAPAQ